MSTGKRVAKRSILGTRVSTLGLDGLYASGMIQAMKTQEDGGVGGGIMPSRYSVRFDDGRRTREVLEADIVGTGFKSVHQVQLPAGQLVFVTHNQREMKGEVVRHDFDSQDVILQVNENETLLKRIEDIRLVESRKSARLVNSDTDFSKLADVSISAGGGSSGSSPVDSYSSTKRKSGSRGSGAIAVPQQRSDYVQITGSRKRRTSESCVNDDEEVMTECSAAMLLMKLSCSPHARLLSPGQQDCRPPSVDSSSGASSFRSSTPSPPLSTSAATDEGIVKDIEQRHVRIIYQCTYPGCWDQRVSVRGIEAHVRKEHLLKDDPDRLLDEGEEEFYYTEIEDDGGPPSPKQLLMQQKLLQQLTPVGAWPYSPSSSESSDSSQLATLSLVDHLDMARPAHEDPGRGAIAPPRHILVPSSSKSPPSLLAAVRRPPQENAPVSMPITIAPSANGSPGKYILISPPSQRSDGGSSSMSAPSPIAAFPSSPVLSSNFVSSSAQSSSTSNMIRSSPAHRRVREGKKCRKVYGLEQRDLWCTQCKWKKACARFGNSNPSASLLMTAAASPPPYRNHHPHVASNVIAASGNAVRAIKF